MTQTPEVHVYSVEVEVQLPFFTVATNLSSAHILPLIVVSKVILFEVTFKIPNSPDFTLDVKRLSLSYKSICIFVAPKVAIFSDPSLLSRQTDP